MGASSSEMKEAEQAGTVAKNALVCPACGQSTPITSLRKDRKDENGDIVYGLRKWEKEEFDFREDDIYSERLYAIKYETSEGNRYYRHPNERDLENEQKVKEIVAKNIVSWQEEGLVPSMAIESGYNTDQVMRERGWTYWHHLFNARQLITNSLFVKNISSSNSLKKNVIGILGVNRLINFNSKLSRWCSVSGVEKVVDVYYNQALNTLYNFGCLGGLSIESSWLIKINIYSTSYINKA